ncbi:anti-sigma factor domain-containing protein [Amycolatopsis sp. EV170708-02-1]|uniref:anti-sigma factor n=1 Tax=Amycolatopsis sp. EV170708-02-1 TaxID=2919322 RepID=UPI001F0BBB7F|nr:anti-sigma factor [Amycolatopsis sp. EV170708-02-1]UMP00127.1 anti-sigma factor [Amycolatopsis sp. EV170708-02-1]
MTAELHTLTGAYALDAVPVEEAAAFERHLRGCPACGQEVRELRETAARLGRGLATAPPPRLREATLTRVSQTRQWSPAVARRGGAVKTRVALWGAAAAAVGALVFGLVTTGTDPARPQLTGVDAVLAAPDASTVRGAERGTTTVVTSRSQGKIVVLAGDLPPLAAGKVYQVWLIGKSGVHSAGLLAPDSPQRTRPVLADLPDGIDRVGITAEPAGGSPAPTVPAVAMVDLA